MRKTTSLPTFWLLPNDCRLSYSANQAHYSTSGMSASERETFIHSLTSGIIFQEGRLRSDLQALGLLGADVSSCHASDDFRVLRASGRHWDYADNASAMRRDAQDMLDYEAEDPYISRHSGEERVVDAAELDLTNLGTMALSAARLIFQRIQTVQFHHETVSRKMVPSIGARHGLICHVLVNEVSTQRRIFLRIHDDGRIGAIPASNDNRSTRWPELVIGVDFERYQWRYRTGWIYQCIYLDLGHVLAALKLHAEHNGLQLEVRSAEFMSQPPYMPLELEPLLIVGLSDDRQAA